ncbi:FHA domain-containing protein [bacterium]|nr:FHA domain-containing protein [bacterium]
MSNSNKHNEVLLTFLEGENEGVELRIIPPRTLVMGRGEDCDIYLSEKKISRNHCQISVEPNGVFVQDLGSTNGTFLNDDILKEKKQAQDSDIVSLGTSKIKLTFSLSEEDAANIAKSSDSDQINTQDKIQEFPDTSHKIEEEVPVSQPQAKAKADAASDPAQDQLDDLDFAQDNSLIEDSIDSSKDAADDFDLVDLGESLDDNAVNTEEPSINDTFNAQDNIDLEQASEDFEIERSINHHEASFAKIKEEQELKASNNASSALSGDLSLMSLPDLLQNLAQNKRSGLLQIEKNKQLGKILLKDGAIMQADLGHVTGLKAVHRMLGWTEGDFQLLATEVKSRNNEPLSENIEGLLMEAFRQMDELKKLKETLPEFDKKFALSKPLKAPLSRLHPKVLTVLQNIFNEGTLQAALDISELTDLETTKVFQYLLDKKYIQSK